FEIRDEEENREVGILLYYEKGRCFIVELMDGLDEWSAPFLFASYVKKGVFTIPRGDSLVWVQNRIIPPSRQNIDMILKNHHLKEYDEMKFLELSGGKCSQDSLYIEGVKELPGYVLRRQAHNIAECSILEDRDLLCIFADDTAKKISMDSLAGIKDVDKIVGNESLFTSCRVGAGGYFITFNNSIDIPAGILYKEGEKIPLTGTELIAFVRNGFADTTEACSILDCSRQNLLYMIRQGYVAPVKEDVKGNLYLKGDVIKNLW
ncbi:MAG: hypothetical protein K5770_10885, partial [Lachnospiraceae bacterium]|nr:hypothetical protein [Lachnospiraceae bacterium]